MVTRCTLFPARRLWGVELHPLSSNWPHGASAGGTGPSRRPTPGVYPGVARPPWPLLGLSSLCERLVGEERGVDSARPSAPILEGAPRPRRPASAFARSVLTPMPSRGGRVSAGVADATGQKEDEP